MEQKEYARINYLLKHMPSLELYASQMDLMKCINCISAHKFLLIYSQLGRYEVRKADDARQINEALKEKQSDLLRSRGFTARL
jgi:hypothetical protein